MKIGKAIRTATPQGHKVEISRSLIDGWFVCEWANEDDAHYGPQGADPTMEGAMAMFDKLVNARR